MAIRKTWEWGPAELRIDPLLEYPNTPAGLSWHLKLDRGYVSRTLKTMEAYRFVTSYPGERDGRRRTIALTEWGRQVLAEIRRCQESAARGTLNELPQRQQRRLVRAMAVIEEVLTRDALANLLEIGRENDPSPDPESPARRAASGGRATRPTRGSTLRRESRRARLPG